MMATAGVMALRRGYPIGRELRRGRGAAAVSRRAAQRCFLLVVIMGGIVGGIFTATEASAVAVVYTFVLSVLVYREVRWGDSGHPAADGLTTAVVMLLVGTSMAMSWAMAYENIPQRVAAGLLTLSQNPVVVLLLINVLLLVVGHVHGHDAGRARVHAHLPAGDGGARHGPGALRHRDGAEPVHRAVHAAVGSVLFVGLRRGARRRSPTWCGRCCRSMPRCSFVLVLVILFPQLSLWLPACSGSEERRPGRKDVYQVTRTPNRITRGATMPLILPASAAPCRRRRASTVFTFVTLKMSNPGTIFALPNWKVLSTRKSSV
jgi:hypothetical protein